MSRIFITAILLYLLFLACYLLWERSVQRKRNATKSPAFKSPPTEEIIGKGRFTLRHSLSEATTLIQSEKRAKNASIFAGGSEKTTGRDMSAAIPPSELDQVFSSGRAADDSGEIDLLMDDPPDEESEPADGMMDAEEGEEAGELTGVNLAVGINFNDLSGMVKAVANPAAATPEEQEAAGWTLVEVRKTDLFEQVVSGEPAKRITAGKLMDDFFAAYHRRKREADEATEETAVKAPKEFNVRAYS